MRIYMSRDRSYKLRLLLRGKRASRTRESRYRMSTWTTDISETIMKCHKYQFNDVCTCGTLYLSLAA